MDVVEITRDFQTVTPRETPRLRYCWWSFSGEISYPCISFMALAWGSSGSGHWHSMVLILGKYIRGCSKWCFWIVCVMSFSLGVMRCHENRECIHTYIYIWFQHFLIHFHIHLNDDVSCCFTSAHDCFFPASFPNRHRFGCQWVFPLDLNQRIWEWFVLMLRDAKNLVS